MRRRGKRGAMFQPTKEVFRKKCREGNLIPVTAEIMADLETPVSAFLKLGGGPYSFLLESVEGGGGSGRYSFLGTGPRTVFRAKGRRAEFLRDGEWDGHDTGDPLALLQDELARYQVVPAEGLPPFAGGAVGYLSYDAVRWFERLPRAAQGRPRPAGRLLHAHRHAARVRPPHEQDHDHGARARRRQAGRGLHEGGARDPVGDRGAQAAAAAGRGRLPRRRGAARLQEPGLAAALREDGRGGQGAHPRRRHPPDGALAALRGAALRRPVRALPRAARAQPLALHVLPQLRRVRARRRLPGADGQEGRHGGHRAADRRHAPARRDPRGGPPPRARAARRREGARRARDARRPRPQRPRPRLPPRHASRSPTT